MRCNIEICIQSKPVKIYPKTGSFIWFTVFLKWLQSVQGILGRVRDGTAASKHAEERGNMVFPLSEAAWSTIEENFLK